MKRFKWPIIGIVAAIIIILIIYSSLQGIPVSVAEVKKGPINEYVEERAKTSLPHIFHITMPLNGRIKPIPFKEGTAVKKGQIVAQMEILDINTTITETKARMNAIKGQIAINKYDALEQTALKESADWIKTMQELVKVSKKKIEANKHVFEYALAHAKSLIESGHAVSKIQQDKAKMEAAVANVDVETAIMTYNAMKVIQSIFNMAPTYVNEFLNRKKLSGNVLNSQLQEIEASLAKHNRDLAKTNMSSPVDGVVLKRYVSNERVMAVGSPLLDIGNLTTLQITADILSQDVINIKPGDSVDIYGPAVGPKPVMGKVLRIEPKGFTKISSLGVEQQRVRVIIDFEDNVLSSLHKQNINLGDSYRVQVKIYTASKKSTLTIPRTALFKNSDGLWQVFAISGSHAVLKVISVGLINDYEVEVLKGLKQGDKVVIAPPTTLADQARVSITRN